MKEKQKSINRKDHKGSGTKFAKKTIELHSAPCTLHLASKVTVIIFAS